LWPIIDIDSAKAASPAYCALYSREYAAARVGDASPGADTATALQRLQDQAYYRCLNQDVEPEFPATSAYFGATPEDITGGIGGPFADIGEGDASVGDETIVATDPVIDATPSVEPEPPLQPKPKVVASKSRGSGLTPWSPEWINWCTQNYRSFNPKTGFVLTLSGERKLCP
jgi:hypothetical protein